MIRKILLFLVISFLLIIFVFVIAVRPLEKIESTTIGNQQMENHFWSSLEDLSFDLSGDGVFFEHSLESDDFNKIIQLSQTSDSQLTALNGSFEGEKVKIIANQKLFSIIPTQYILYLTPFVKDGRMALQLDKASMGRIPLSKRMITPSLEKLQSDFFVVDKDDPASIVFVGIPRSFLFEEIKVAENKLFIGFRVQINSFLDVLELGDFMMPDQLLDLIKEQLLTN